MMKRRMHRRLGKRILHVLLLLLLFVGAACLPAIAHLTPSTTLTVQQSRGAEEWVQQGRSAYEAEQFNDAVEAWQRATEAFAAEGDRLGQAMALSNLSLTHQQLSQWSEAETAVQRALALLTEDAVVPEEIGVWMQALEVRGQLRLLRGQAAEALADWQRAAELYDPTMDQARLVRNQINQAQALQALGLYRQARDRLTLANQTLEQQPDSLLKAIGLRSLGNVLRVVGDSGAAQAALQHSLAIAQALNNSEAIAESLLGLGNTAQTQQQPEIAIDYYQQAIAIAPSLRLQITAYLRQLDLWIKHSDLQSSAIPISLTQLRDDIEQLPLSRTAIFARIELAQCAIKLNSSLTSSVTDQRIETLTPNAIANLLSTAIAASRQLDDPRAEAYSLGTLGHLYEQSQQWQAAIDLTQQALNVAQQVDALDIAYQWQWQLGRVFKAKWDRGRQQTQRLWKHAIAAYDGAVKTLQVLRYDLVAVNSDAQFSFRDEVEPVYREYVELLLHNTAASTSADNLKTARQVIESLQVAELNNFFRQACVDAQYPIDQIIDQQDPSAAVLYPIILSDRLDVILKLPNQDLRHYSTAVSATEVQAIVTQLRQDLVTPHRQRFITSTAQQIYNWLIRPAEAALANSQTNTLVFVLDGDLRNIPMAVLHDGNQYLIERYSIALTPGLQLINPTALRQVQLRGIVAGLSEARPGFAALPNVTLELQDIQTSIPSQVLLNEEFTSAALQEEIRSVPFPVVHLATHGQFSSEANQTFIVAWDRRIYVDELQAVLQTRDELQTDAIELLVLSACQTAAGDRRAALGLAGVAIRAGSRSTLASLWNINDASTALLMQEFYRAIANRSMTKADALRQAQRSLITNPYYQNPMNWAAFVLVGNWL